MNELVEQLRGRRIAVLTGAGCSTESGIPDYRGPSSKPRRAPMEHKDFVGSEDHRRRYWSRSYVGWPKIRAAEPNAAHAALARLETAGFVTGIITQNVDGLHQAAGSEAVNELHGALRKVVCLTCDRTTSRDDLQARLEWANPGHTSTSAPIRPDGDAEVTAEESFVVAPCEVCGGVLKPDVVFFGGSVPRPRVDAGYALVEDCDVLLVVGTSLAVFSGLRFVRRAVDRGRTVVIVNQGPTRGDPFAALTVDARAGACLTSLSAELL